MLNNMVRKIVCMIRPLEGVRVLDLTTMPPWGYATLILSELGAEVIKIEQPSVGDATRRFPPFKRDVSLLHLMINRGKKSVALNLKSETGREVLYKLCRISDVLIEGFRPSTTMRLGIDYGTVRKINDKMIYCSITAFGQSGQYSSVPAHDLNVMALTGALSMTRQSDGKPIIPGILLADFATALFASLSIVSSLLERERTGKGKHIDVSMAEGVFPFMVIFIADFLGSGLTPHSGEHLLMGGVPCYNIYETKDGRYVTLGMPVEKHLWQKFCEAVGREDLTDKQYEKDAINELRRLFKTKTREEWIRDLFFKIECFAPMLELEEALSGDLVKEKEVLLELEDPYLGKVPIFSVPLCIRSKILEMRSPKLGEHTEETLLMLGYSREEIKSLRELGVIG
jgi:crotonobetainyl-CoA:carnitine CoA-transferase CaiB-like acyl-CoA transferase